MRDEIFNILERYGDWYAENYVPTLPHERQLSGEQALSRIMDIVTPTITRLEGELAEAKKNFETVQCKNCEVWCEIKNRRLVDGCCSRCYMFLLNSNNALKAKLQKMEEALKYIINRAWVGVKGSHNQGKWINEFVDVAKHALTPPSQEKECKNAYVKGGIVYNCTCGQCF